MGVGVPQLASFANAIWPCIQQNYPDLINGVTQLVGAAALIAKGLRSVGASSGSGGGMLSSLLGKALPFLDKIGLNKQ